MSLLARSLICAAIVASLSLGLFGCSDGPNTQYLPVGERCSDDGQCGTSPYVCEMAPYPGGYCDKPCAVSTDCPSDSVCAVTHCRRACTDSAQCRQAEGYVCRPTGADKPYCDLPLSNP